MKTKKYKFHGETWEVETEGRIIKLKDLKIPKGWQLIPHELFAYLWGKGKIELDPQWDLIELLDRHKKKDYKWSALGGYNCFFGGRLVVYGNDFDGVGYAFRVRFCRMVK